MTTRTLTGRLGIAPDEARPLALSFAAFTLLLAGYYIVRPVRDALAATLGADSIKYLSTAVFFVMLAIVPVFGWLATRVPRPRLVPGLYAFFAVNLVVFAWAFGHYPSEAPAGTAWARVFYVWVTVFNLFAVSVFWSRMAEVWREPQGRRYFGVVSAGGSLGGILGPLLGRELAAHVALSGLLSISAVLLLGSLAALARLRPPTVGVPSTAVPSTARPFAEPSGGAILEGLWLITRTPFLLGIAGLVMLGSLAGMIVYIEMARLVAAAYPNVIERTAFYATRDLWVNAGSLLLQLFLVGQVTRRVGVGAALMAASMVALATFAALGLYPTLATLTAVSVIMRCTEFGLGKPARDMLYTVVPPTAKYQSKNVIDTAVYRGSDMASGWLQAAIGRLGVTLSGWGWLAAGLSVLLFGLAALVGRGYRRRGGV